MRICVVLISMFWLSLICGCAPFPHFVILAPQISGKITNANSPIETATVYFSQRFNEPCHEGAVNATLTDRTGAFKIERITQFRMLYVPMVAPVSAAQYTLCVSALGRTYIGYKDLAFLYQDNADLTLSCEISHPERVSFVDGTEGETICKAMPRTRKGD